MNKIIKILLLMFFVANVCISSGFSYAASKQLDDNDFKVVLALDNNTSVALEKRVSDTVNNLLVKTGDILIAFNLLCSSFDFNKSERLPESKEKIETIGSSPDLVYSLDQAVYIIKNNKIIKNIVKKYICFLNDTRNIGRVFDKTKDRAKYSCGQIFYVDELSQKEFITQRLGNHIMNNANGINSSIILYSI